MSGACSSMIGPPVDNYRCRCSSPETLLGMPHTPGDVIAQRVRLRDHARPLRRSTTEVQFGLVPHRGIVVTGLSEAETGWLLSLASVPRRPTPRSRTVSTQPGVLLGTASRWGLSAPRALELLDVLRAHDLLDDDSRPVVGAGDQGRPMMATQRPGVCVLGTGSVPDSIRSHTARCEVATVTDAFNLDDPPGLTVLVVRDAVGERDRASWASSGLTHLPVIVGAQRAVLGPLVTAHEPGPCLVCLDLSRKDRDTAWPYIAAQVSAVPCDWDCDITVDPPLDGVIGALAAMLISAHVDKVAVPKGVTWEVALPWPQVTTRVWHRHPACVEHDDEMD